MNGVQACRSGRSPQGLCPPLISLSLLLSFGSSLSPSIFLSVSLFFSRSSHASVSYPVAIPHVFPAPPCLSSQAPLPPCLSSCFYLYLQLGLNFSRFSSSQNLDVTRDLEGREAGLGTVFSPLSPTPPFLPVAVHAALPQVIRSETKGCLQESKHSLKGWSSRPKSRSLLSFLRRLSVSLGLSL